MDIKSRYVVISSIPRESVIGLHHFTDPSSGRKLNKTKVGDAKDLLQANPNSKIGGLANYISYTPWLDQGVQKVDSLGNPLTLQDKYEQQFNLEKGFLTNKMWRRGESLDPSKLTYFQTQHWKLNEGSTILDLQKFDDLMGYFVALASPKVANSEKEWRQHKWPKAEYYISSDIESAEIKYRIAERRAKAISELFKEDMTSQTQRRLVSLLDLVSAKSEISQEQVFLLLNDYLNSTRTEAIDKFNALIGLLSTAPGREEFEARYYLRRLVDYRVVHEKGQTYTWPRQKGVIILGETQADAVVWLLNPKKAALHDELREELESRQ